MNAGAYKSQFSNIIDSVLVYDKGNMVWMSNEACQFAYRTSIFQSRKDVVILGARLKLEYKDKQEILDTMEDRRSRRFATQPLNYPSCGSVFRNLDDMPAWKCIDAVGLRGYRIGDAQISEKHPNWIVNLGNATAADYYALIQLMKSKVKQQLNIELETEVERFNWQD